MALATVNSYTSKRIHISEWSLAQNWLEQSCLNQHSKKEDSADSLGMMMVWLHTGLPG